MSPCLHSFKLHSTAKLSSVYQRTDNQLLLTMYDESRQCDHIVEPARATRQALKLNLRQYRLHNKKYINSPYIRGKGLWDNLPRDIQHLESKFEFKAKIKPMFAFYNGKYLEP